MHWLAAALALCGAFMPTAALTKEEAGVVDWHRALIGVPLTHWAHTAPSFHHVDSGSVILAATGSNVLAALNPLNGSLGLSHSPVSRDEAHSIR
jgi:ER membrane protein complex subunit 1